MDLGIKGKNAAVAAASAGLGLGSARALREEGANVAICGRNKERIEAAAKEIGAVPIVADVSHENGARAFVEAARKELGPLSILVPNAGGPPPGQPSQSDRATYQAALDLNCLATITMCQAVLPDMKEAGWGRIAAITSAGARSPIGFLAASSVARAAVTSFLKMLATEVAPHGITVNSVQPGLHATDRVKALGSLEDLAKRVATPEIGDAEDFGKLVAFLCSEPSRFITGTGVLVDGGSFPGLV